MQRESTRIASVTAFDLLLRLARFRPVTLGDLIALLELDERASRRSRALVRRFSPGSNDHLGAVSRWES
jgi:hypothetical protein